MITFVNVFDFLKPKLDWTVNEKSGGIWRISHLINQGQPTQNLGKLRDILQTEEFNHDSGEKEKNLSNLVPDNALFGAAISELTVESSQLGIVSNYLKLVVILTAENFCKF